MYRERFPDLGAVLLFYLPNMFALFVREPIDKDPKMAR